MKKVVLAAAFSLLALAFTPKGMAPLPAQYIHGNTFHSPDGWFSADALAGWEWFEMRAFDGDADPRWPDGAHSSVAWYVNDPKGGAVTVLESYGVSAPMIDKRYADGMEDDVRKAAGDQPISDFFIEMIDFPEKDSIHYTYKQLLRSGKTAYCFRYVSGWEHKVFLMAEGPSREEPKALTRMARSFKWLKMP
jgi:hypothetical protein